MCERMRQLDTDLLRTKPATIPAAAPAPNTSDPRATIFTADSANVGAFAGSVLLVVCFDHAAEEAV